MFLELDRDSSAHLALALETHFKNCRQMGLRVPSELHPLAAHCRSRATQGQTVPEIEREAGAEETWGVIPKLLTYQQAATLLAVSERTVKRIVQLGDLPHVRIGGAVRLRRTDIDAYISALN